MKVPEKEGLDLKDLELELISELMKNSRRSDRELAKALRVSQPTISRTMERIKKRGLIREFTVIPDFQKLGYELVAFTLIRMKSGLSAEELEKARRIGLRDMQEKSPPEIVLFERGLGGGYTGIIVSFHHNYTEYAKLKEMMKEYPFVDHGAILSFLLDLNDSVHYRYFTFSTLAKHVLTNKKEKR
jgi:DNA-binding Lrp family transcriptional regulator